MVFAPDFALPSAIGILSRTIFVFSSDPGCTQFTARFSDCVRSAIGQVITELAIAAELMNLFGHCLTFVFISAMEQHGSPHLGQLNGGLLANAIGRSGHKYYVIFNRSHGYTRVFCLSFDVAFILRGNVYDMKESVCIKIPNGSTGSTSLTKGLACTFPNDIKNLQIS